MPYEARQPSISLLIEMVPIHSKLLALVDERKDTAYNYAFLLICRKAFIILRTQLVNVPSELFELIYLGNGKLD